MTESAAIASENLKGVRREMKEVGTHRYWYWVACWYDKQPIRENYPETTFGAERARELAFEAKRVEDEFTRRMKDKQMSRQERKAIRAERMAARQARNFFIRSNEDGLIRGVTFDPKQNRYIARWYCSRNKEKKKSFAVSKFGDERAKAMAIEFKRSKDDFKARLIAPLDSPDESAESSA